MKKSTVSYCDFQAFDPANIVEELMNDSISMEEETLTLVKVIRVRDILLEGLETNDVNDKNNISNFLNNISELDDEDYIGFWLFNRYLLNKYHNTIILKSIMVFLLPNSG